MCSFSSPPPSEVLAHLWSGLIVTTHSFKRFQFCCRLKQQAFKIVSLCFSCGYLAALQLDSMLCISQTVSAVHLDSRRQWVLYTANREMLPRGYENVPALSNLCHQGALATTHRAVSSAATREQKWSFHICYETSEAGSICWRHLIWNIGCKFITSQWMELEWNSHFTKYIKNTHLRGSGKLHENITIIQMESVIE